MALLLERYLERLDDEPFLIVPNRSDVEACERDLLRRAGALISGSIGTFDDLFERIAAADPERRPVATEAQRVLVARRAVARAELGPLRSSTRFAGFLDSLLATLDELHGALVAPEQVDGDLGALLAAYRAELDGLGLWDRALLRARAAERLGTDLGAWRGEPVFAYGFEDLTASEWALVQALSGRGDVTVSIPYEPGRPAFAALQGTVDELAALAQGRLEQLPPRFAEFAPPALAHLERGLFADVAPAPAPIEGAVRFFEGAGPRGALELVGEELLGLIRAGTAPERIAIVCPSVERWRAPLETALGTLGVPYALEGRVRLAQTPYGQALLALLRFAWLGGGRGDLYRYLRSPYSGISRQAVDFAEGRLRGRAVTAPERVEAETERLRGAPVPALDALRVAGTAVEAARSLARSMLRAAHGLEAPPPTEAARDDLRAHDAALRILDELDAWERLAEPVDREGVAAALEHGLLRRSAGERGRVAVLDLMRARTRRFDAVFLLGLEEGSLPRRSLPSPFLDDESRERLGPRLRRPDPVARDRHLFYTACTRATARLYLVREAATDEGTPRQPGPFWDEVQALYDREDVSRWTRSRPLSQLTWPLEGAPTERERLRALAALVDEDPGAAAGLAAANGWERALDRARAAFDRRTRLTHPSVLAGLGARTTFNVTELERFADCSSAWFVERFLDPKTIDPEVDAKLKGSVAHNTLHRFFTRLPKELGSERVEAGRLEGALGLMVRCLDETLQGLRLELTDMQRRELRQSLLRDLEQLVRLEAESELALVPRRFEVAFGSDRAAPELQRGLDLDGIRLSGKIDRIDVDPYSASGIVVDYKSGRSAHSAAEIEKELRLQIPLYMLVLRDLVGMEPLGGVYRPLGGDRRPRGLLRAGAREESLPGFAGNDYLDEDAFWAQVEGARETARGLAERIRGGDVAHDPKGGECPAWCDLWTVCRIRRP
ncbi:MAG: PD-(D/E)XK nuclease family protein [Gaiellaceae bacterium]